MLVKELLRIICVLVEDFQSSDYRLWPPGSGIADIWVEDPDLVNVNQLLFHRNIGD